MVCCISQCSKIVAPNPSNNSLCVFSWVGSFYIITNSTIESSSRSKLLLIKCRKIQTAKPNSYRSLCGNSDASLQIVVLQGLRRLKIPNLPAQQV